MPFFVFALTLSPPSPLLTADTMEDVYVGWRFGPLFFEKNSWKWLPRWCCRQKHVFSTNNADSDATGLLDKRLIHDILPQRGGGQEPIEG